MATMEKPKKQKNKRSKRKPSHNDKELNIKSEEHEYNIKDKEEETIIHSSFEELPSISAKYDRIISHECAVSKEYKSSSVTSLSSLSKIELDDAIEPLEIRNCAPVNTEQAEVEEEESLSASALPISIEIPATVAPVSVETAYSCSPKEWTTNFEEPSAPVASKSATKTLFNFKLASNAATASPTSPPLLKYPDLSGMNHTAEMKTDVFFQPKYQKTHITTTSSNLKPFTVEQMKEFYHCTNIELVKQFELEFLMNALLENYNNDPLYCLLMEYYNLQTKLNVNRCDIQKHRDKSKLLQEDIWTEVPKKVTFSGVCGDGVTVRTTETYNIAKLNGKNLESAEAELNKIFDLVFYTFTTNHINAHITKHQIERIINEISSYPAVEPYASSNNFISLNKSLDAETLQCVSHMRRAISILFSFVRKPCPNKTFDWNIKEWLNKLVSLHLLMATKEDHWFLLFHLLRCPSGIGSWATPFLQLPINCSKKVKSSSTSQSTEIPLSLTSPEINHCIAILHILLLPIKKRNEFLKAFTQSHKEISDPVKDDLWIIIDSDGEDSNTPTGECAGLKESDLIALLNQIPFEKIFSSALSIEKFLNDFIIEPDLISTNQVIKVISFCSTLVELFGEGMLTYNMDRYKQLAKRLGRLVRHTLQYVTDYHELFIRNNLSKDPYMCERITIELNAILIKSCSYIYRTRNLATWQYFSSLPFTSFNDSTIWQLFYYLNVGFPSEFPAPHEDYVEQYNATDFWTKFNIAIADSSDEDLYYLLQAFYEMANERDKAKDWELIKTICLHIFNIGYINEPTRDVCYKTSRDMLVNLTLAYEDLLSCILLQVKIRLSEIENATYLFKSLPLENWKPGMDSFEILSNWLLYYDYKSQINTMARIVISHLSWDFDSDGHLYLPHNIHVRMAILVSEALTKHAPEVVGISGLSDSFRHVSSLIDSTQSTKEQFTAWCWNMVSILRLHLMDQSVESIRNTLRRPTDALMSVPELERIDIIYQGITEKRSLAIYISILVSLWGHSIPLICQKGFEQMKQLLTDYRYAAVIRCIELVVPLFLDSPETLAHCESFHSVLVSLINSDRTYMKMAKDMIYPNMMGPVLELLNNMIHNQIINYTKYGLSTPLGLVNVWLQSLTNITNWQNTSVTYLIDKILKVAYQFPDARQSSLEYFRVYYKDCDEWKGNNKLSTFKMLLGSNQTRIPTLSPLTGWMALVQLEIEFKTQEANLWPEFLRQIVLDNGKNNFEIILKKTASIIKIPSFAPHMLVIYKYANLIATMEVSHPVFPLINQQFFELYLARVPLHYEEESFQHTYGVSDKFYEFNVPLMKKIKTNLKAAESYFTREATNHAVDEELSCFFCNCSKMMKTYSLWLEETSINKLSKDQQNFPLQYNTEKLKEILNGNVHHWTEFLYLPLIRKEQKHQAELWARKCFRSKSTKLARNVLHPRSRTTPIVRIKNQLLSYDKPLEPPQWRKPPPNEDSKKFNNINIMLAYLKTLETSAKKFHFHTSELNSLNRTFKDIITELYKNFPYNEVIFKSCNILDFTLICVKPAKIMCKFEAIHKDNVIDRRIRGYRERHDELVESTLSSDVDDLSKSIVQLETQIRYLITTRMTNSEQSELTRRNGEQLFFYIADMMKEMLMKFPTTSNFCSRMVLELGVFIEENQEFLGLRVLKLALERPDLLEILAGVFVPYRTKPECFINLYKFLIDSNMKRCDSKILFVLLSKFDLVVWLETFRPKLADINQLLQLISFGLECWNQPDSKLLQDIFRRHLVHIFSYDFPEHYGEVMQLVLNRISEQKFRPLILLDLMNGLLKQFNCEPMDLDTPPLKIQEISIDFARRQNLFSIKGAVETVGLFARHFQKERLQHGLHGLYPKHKEYCQPLSIWFSCFGHVVVIAAICSYQDLLADQISDYIFGTIIDMYSPWLITYTSQTIQQPAANWIRQMTENGNVLLPWSAIHANTSKIIIRPLIDTITFVLENLPVSQTILGHIFGWYIHHFAVTNIEQHVRAPIHEGIAQLPWELFKPLPNYIDLLYDSLQQFIPESHSLLGHIYIRIDWNSWIKEFLPKWQPKIQSHIVSRLLSIFIRISYEPNIHMHPNTHKILEDAIHFPWHLVDYTELENIFKWYLSSLESVILLQLPSETNYADRAVLDLLKVSCAMWPERLQTGPISNATAKRILYTRSYVRLLRMCAAKHHNLLATKEGSKAFKAAFVDLLNMMDKAVAGVSKSREAQEREALNFMIEIIVPMQTQIEETSNFFIDTMIEWQAPCTPGNVLMCSTLNATGHSKAFIAGIYKLIEATIANYFRTSDENKESHVPSWNSLIQSLQMAFDKLKLMPIINGQHFFILHVFICYQIETLQSLGEKITFLQDQCQLLENVKTNNLTEPRIAIVWGIIISRGCKFLSESENAKKPLLMLARHFHVLSTQAEGWGEGLLGVIGLKKDGITNKRKVLTRCLSCIIFSLFPDTSSSSQQLNQEYVRCLNDITALLANKKFVDVKLLIVKAIAIINENKFPNVRDVPHMICRTIALFYNDHILTTIPEIWNFDFKLLS